MKSRKIASKLGVVILTAATLIGSMGRVQAMAATSEQTIGISGTVTSISTLDVTVPVQPLEFTIDNEGVFTSTAKTISNQTAVPVYTYITEVYGASGNCPEIINSTAYGDWSSLDHDATLAKMALQLNGNELARVYQQDSATKSEAGNYIALGVIPEVSGELNLQLTGNNGKDWRNAEDIVFSYNANILFTTIEGNFGNGQQGGGGGQQGGEQSITAFVNDDGDIAMQIANLQDDISGQATVEVQLSKSLDDLYDEGAFLSFAVQEFGNGAGLKFDDTFSGNVVTFTDEDCSTHDFYAFVMSSSEGKAGQSLWNDGLYIEQIKFTLDSGAEYTYIVTHN